MTRECVFCNIISKKNNTETEVLFENESFVIIKDIRPACDFHYLAIPKKHINDGRDLQVADKPLLIKMEQGLRNLFAKKKHSLRKNLIWISLATICQCPSPSYAWIGTYKPNEFYIAMDV